VNHLWRLLSDLEIPHATLLDLDWGRDGGGWGRIKSTCAQLLQVGIAPGQIWQNPNPAGPQADLDAFDGWDVTNRQLLNQWAVFLRTFHVYFCMPLDLDYSMLKAFPAEYQLIEPDRHGPSPNGDPRSAVLGEQGRGDLYATAEDLALRWYRYLFLGRGKPSTHVRVLSSMDEATLAAGAPEELAALLLSIVNRLSPPPGADLV
jgi:putative ATP-dependent endonuclease of OLD family